MTSFLYPQFHVRSGPVNAENLYSDLLDYTNELKFLLEQMDTHVNQQPALRVITVASISELGNPRAGDICFATSASKFRGYNGTAWVNFY